jgi:xanthine/CO dehydrogenase XdhC/CoxF family maturation factor
MPYPVFTLHVPADPTYRTIACEMASRYVDMTGGTETQREAFHALLTKTLDELTGGREEDVEFLCVADPPGFAVTLKCGGQSAVIRHPVHAEKP